jgi:hypothetical protein
MVNDEMDCPSNVCRSDDCLKRGDSAVGVNFLSKNDVEYVGKSSKINDDAKEDVTTSKSTRLKKLPIKKYQDFFMLNENHIINNTNEQNVSGASDSSDYCNRLIDLPDFGCNNFCSSQ